MIHSGTFATSNERKTRYKPYNHYQKFKSMVNRCRNPTKNPEKTEKPQKKPTKTEKKTAKTTRKNRKKFRKNSTKTENPSRKPQTFTEDSSYGPREPVCRIQCPTMQMKQHGKDGRPRQRHLLGAFTVTQLLFFFFFFEKTPENWERRQYTPG